MERVANNRDPRLLGSGKPGGGRRRGRRNKENNKLPPFVPLTWDMLNHQAYKDLPPSAAKALPYFLGKVRLSPNDPQRYESEFDFTYPEARKYGFAEGTFSNIINHLVEHGFIDLAYKGGLRGDSRSKSLFTLSERWRKYGTEEFVQVNRKSIIPRKNATNSKM
ncbi:MAG TPA: hypothetical protein PLR20_14505 [Syntrophales bacterium]|nr:hypothetical protein [Syntrophales bacterium]HPN25799.1 hypothetical protein [Syntrophales bacterium]HQM30556.1 hypothetical protein [Syntrophales bacterium]